MRLATPDLQNHPCLLTTTVDTTKHYLPSVYPSASSLLSPRTVPNPNQPIKMVLINNILARNHGKKVGWTRVCNTVKVCFCRAAARRLFERKGKGNYAVGVGQRGTEIIHQQFVMHICISNQNPQNPTCYPPSKK